MIYTHVLEGLWRDIATDYPSEPWVCSRRVWGLGFSFTASAGSSENTESQAVLSTKGVSGKVLEVLSTPTTEAKAL